MCLEVYCSDCCWFAYWFWVGVFVIDVWFGVVGIWFAGFVVFVNIVVCSVFKLEVGVLIGFD